MIIRGINGFLARTGDAELGRSVATLSADSDLTARQLSFVTPEDLDQARDLGLYLKAPTAWTSSLRGNLERV